MVKQWLINGQSVVDLWLIYASLMIDDGIGTPRNCAKTENCRNCLNRLVMPATFVQDVKLPDFLREIVRILGG